MAVVAYDDVQETTNTGGLGDLVLGGAALGYRTFGSVCADADQFSYSIRSSTGTAEFESGIARYNSGANSITRLEVTASSNAGAKVNLPATGKVIYMTQLAKQIKPIGAYPFVAADGMLFRWNSMLSRVDLSSLGFANKGYDISGNGRDIINNVTNPPKWLPMGFNRKFHAVYFDGTVKWMVNGMPQLPSPLACTVVFVGQGFISGGNSHIYNWSGNPIGFGSNTPLDFMYNGTLPAAHPMSGESFNRVPSALDRYPIIGIHVYNGAASVQSLNNNEVTVSPGTAVTGVTNNFTIGSDSSSGVGGGVAQAATMRLAEMATFNFAFSAAQRAAMYTYLRAFFELPIPPTFIPPFG